MERSFKTSSVALIRRRAFTTTSFYRNANTTPTSSSSDVLTERTQTYLKDKKNLKPKITTYEACKQWFQLVNQPRENLQIKQDNLMKLAFPGYYQSQVGQLKATNNKIPIDSDGNYLNEIKIENGTAPLQENVEKTNNLVMIHGYASASGLFYKNFHELISQQPNSRIYSLDLLGFGLSSKKPFDSTIEETGSREFPITFDLDKLKSAKHVHSSLKLPDHYDISIEELEKYDVANQRKIITEVEDYYIDALENWRIQNNLENFTLFGHSLGGYLSIAYALKYPSRVEKLILVSPGGVERSPFAITNPIHSTQNKLDNSSDKNLELTPSMSPDSYDFLGRYPILSDLYKELWIRELAPTRLLRLAGPWSYKIFYLDMFRKLSRNLKNFDNVHELKIVIDYLYNSVMVKSTLDYLIMKLFASSVVGKYPMYDRIQDLQTKKNIWLFGEFDFMFNSIGETSNKKLNKLGIDSEFKIIPKSGHNLYFDNWEEFNKQIKTFLNWK